MGIASDILSLLGEVQVGAALRERLAQIEKDCAKLSKRNEELQELNARLVAENRKLAERIAENSAKPQFEEKRGVLFKRKAGGGYEEVPYCPVCRVPLSFFVDEMPLNCPRCAWSPLFPARQLAAIAKELP